MFVLNHRETALLIWMVIFFIGSSLNIGVRKALIDLAKAGLNKTLLTIYILMFLFVFLIIYPINVLGIWDISWLKNTILWTLSAGLVMIYNYENAAKQKYFRNSVKNHLKIIIVLQFLVNFYVFGLWVELVLLPILTFVTAVQVYSETDKKYTSVSKYSNILLSVFGVFVLGFAIYKIIKGFDMFDFVSTAKDFFLPIYLSISFLPFVYCLSLYATYDHLFRRLKYTIDNENLYKFAKRKILLKHHLNLGKLKLWSKNLNTLLIKEEKDIIESLNSLKSST